MVKVFAVSSPMARHFVFTHPCFHPLLPPPPRFSLIYGFTRQLLRLLRSICPYPTVPSGAVTLTGHSVKNIGSPTASQSQPLLLSLSNVMVAGKLCKTSIRKVISPLPASFMCQSNCCGAPKTSIWRGISDRVIRSISPSLVNQTPPPRRSSVGDV